MVIFRRKRLEEEYLAMLLGIRCRCREKHEVGGEKRSNSPDEWMERDKTGKGMGAQPQAAEGSQGRLKMGELGGPGH